MSHANCCTVAKKHRYASLMLSYKIMTGTFGSYYNNIDTDAVAIFLNRQQ